MYVIATTYFGERIRIKCSNKEAAITHLSERGVQEDWIHSLEVEA